MLLLWKKEGKGEKPLCICLYFIKEMLEGRVIIKLEGRVIIKTLNIQYRTDGSLAL